MCKIKLLLLSGALFTALATGCQPLIRPVTPTAQTTVQPTSETTNRITDTVAIADTGVVSDAVSTIASTAIAMTSTVASAETATVSATAATAEVVVDTPTPGADQSTASPAPMLTVVIASLRIRSGPGTEYPVLGAAAQSEQYSLVGQAHDCQWYQVAHPQLGEVWLSGDAQHVATNVSCDQVAAALIPTPQPTEAVTIAATAVPAQTQQTDNPTPAQPGDDPFPADQGCLLLQNQLGPELTFTFTNADGGWSNSIKVSTDQDVPYCLTPGRYRITVDAPPPWSSLNRDFEIKAGDRAYFPIRPQ